MKCLSLINYQPLSRTLLYFILFYFILFYFILFYFRYEIVTRVNSVLSTGLAKVEKEVVALIYVFHISNKPC